MSIRIPTLQYVALGDSTGVGIGANRDGGYVSRLARMLQQPGRVVKLTNLCESGAVAADVLDDQVPKLRHLRADLLTLAVGTNDIARELPEEVFMEHLEEIASHLALMKTRVVLANIPDVALAPVAQHVRSEIYEKRIEVFNEHIEATAARHGFALVDLFAFSRETLPGHREYFCPDGFHPSPLGYDAWTRSMWPVVKDTLRL